jgi:hypothetical protein
LEKASHHEDVQSPLGHIFCSSEKQPFNAATMVPACSSAKVIHSSSRSVKDYSPLWRTALVDQLTAASDWFAILLWSVFERFIADPYDAIFRPRDWSLQTDRVLGFFGLWNACHVTEGRPDRSEKQPPPTDNAVPPQRK